MSSEPIPGRCGSPLRGKPGQYCEHILPMANGRCRLHGGKSPGGGNLKHGRDSRYAKAFGALYAERLAAADLRTVDPSIAVLDSRILEKREELGSDPPSRHWRAARKLHGELAEAIRTQDSAGVRRALDALADVMSEGMAAASGWDEIVDLTCKKAALVLRAQEVDLKAQAQLTTDDLGKHLTLALDTMAGGFELAIRMALKKLDREDLLQDILLQGRYQAAKVYEQRCLPKPQPQADTQDHDT